MSVRGYKKNRFSRTPRVGTVANDVFRALLKGLRSDEAFVRWGKNYSQYVNKLDHQCGFDVRRIPTKLIGNYAHTRGRKHPSLIMIVGRYKWNGGYVSFINPEKVCEDLA
jgi:hypothetical protein